MCVTFDDVNVIFYMMYVTHFFIKTIQLSGLHIFLERKVAAVIWSVTAFRRRRHLGSAIFEWASTTFGRVRHFGPRCFGTNFFIYYFS